MKMTPLERMEARKRKRELPAPEIVVKVETPPDVGGKTVFIPAFNLQDAQLLADAIWEAGNKGQTYPILRHAEICVRVHMVDQFVLLPVSHLQDVMRTIQNVLDALAVDEKPVEKAI